MNFRGTVQAVGESRPIGTLLCVGGSRWQRAGTWPPRVAWPGPPPAVTDWDSEGFVNLREELVK